MSATPADKLKAAEFEEWVATTARLEGWSVMRGHKGLASQPSVPDLLLFRGEESVAVKVMTAKAGRDGPTERQQEWLDTLWAAGFDTAHWTPSDHTAALSRLRSLSDNESGPETAFERSLP